MVLKVLDLTVVVVLKELILTVSTLQGCDSCVERTDFNSFYFANVWQF